MVDAAAKIYSNPPISFSTQQWQIEGKTVLEIIIEPSKTKPHFAKDENGKWLAYQRVDDENILAGKIQVNVWKKNSSSHGIHFTYSEHEKFLIDYLLKNPSITISKFIRQAHVSRNKAEEVLTNFILMDVIKMTSEKEATFFSLNKMPDETALKKFRY
jgi:predicted HTH transcriptional regulator